MQTRLDFHFWDSSNYIKSDYIRLSITMSDLMPDGSLIRVGFYDTLSLNLGERSSFIVISYDGSD